MDKFEWSIIFFCCSFHIYRLRAISCGCRSSPFKIACSIDYMSMCVCVEAFSISIASACQLHLHHICSLFSVSLLELMRKNNVLLAITYSIHMLISIIITHLQSGCVRAWMTTGCLPAFHSCHCAIALKFYHAFNILTPYSVRRNYSLESNVCVWECVCSLRSKAERHMEECEGENARHEVKDLIRTLKWTFIQTTIDFTAIYFNLLFYI